jgi:hypothetical protein
VGAEFKNPNKKIITISKELSRSFTQGEFNDYLLNQLQLVDSIPHEIEIRVRSTIGTANAVPLYSNVLRFTVVPYAIPPKVIPPATGELYIVGSATPGGWNNPVPVPAQKFTKLSETLYEIDVDLVGGGAYLLLPTNGQWAKYSVADDTVPGLANGGDFGRELPKDIPAPGTPGRYKITVNFQTGKFTVVKI